VSGKADNSKRLYQQIYDNHPWYGNANDDRCPGVRLLPLYRHWLIEPILDLGCGRGHTVDRLRQMGLEADGIDQVNLHPEMRVGDISMPISGIRNFNSVVCIDCIEHMPDSQLLGLFSNMRQVQQQVFSIHNGPSSGTGQELHVNRREFDQWREILAEHFDIQYEIATSPEQMLYLARRMY
jgi:hypothetical protein